MTNSSEIGIEDRSDQTIPSPEHASASPAEQAEALDADRTGGRTEPVRPAAANRGTVVELRDLFFATPARLKFLRSDRAETQAVAEVIRRLAMAEPFVGFTLTDEDEDRALADALVELGLDGEAQAGRA